MPTSYQARLRHARHYLRRLATADTGYQAGGAQMQAGLALFDTSKQKTSSITILGEAFIREMHLSLFLYEPLLSKGLKDSWRVSRT